MSSPIPPDPYHALGVLKDADISAIRSAHRKLVLKLHPDRIKDEAEKLKGKDEFQKVQQAYELLSDPDKRSRYDDRIKLAALRKEAMTRESPMRTTSASYPMRPAPPSSTYSSSRRDYRPDGNVYEERKPEDYFGSRESFSSRDRFDDEPSRASSRKYDGPSERRNSTKTSESKSKKSGWESGVSGMSANMAFKLKKKAAEAKGRTEEKRSKEREREKNAAKTKLRDQEQRRDRSEKRRHVYAGDESSSDSDTATQVTDATIRGPTVETIRPSSSRSSPRSSIRREEPKRSSERSRRYEGEDEEYEDAWLHKHRGAEEYLASSGHRPTTGRTESHSYWQGEDRARRSGSDSDRRPTSSKGRRPSVDETKGRPPSMPTHSSSPANLRPYVEERVPRDSREPQRSASGSVLPERDQRRETPPFTRSKTMPNSKSSTKKDTAPAKSSNLKHTETHDSGYGSSSSPHTPELGGTSPTRDSRGSRREPPRQTSKTKYQIVDPLDDDDDYGQPIGRAPTVILEDEDRHRRFQSPERRSERPERPRIVTSDRPKSSRGSSSKVEASSTRPREVRRDSERRTARASPPISRTNSGRGGALFNEIVDEDTSPHPRQPESPKFDSYGRRDSRDDRDYVPSSRHRENLNFSGSRRPSVDVR
jgi:curved DNA-binding protein CbpA